MEIKPPGHLGRDKCGVDVHSDEAVPEKHNSVAMPIQDDQQDVLMKMSDSKENLKTDQLVEYPEDGDFKLFKENLNEISYFITINEGMRMNDKPRIVSCNIVEVRVVKWNFNFALLS